MSLDHPLSRRRTRTKRGSAKTAAANRASAKTAGATRTTARRHRRLGAAAIVMRRGRVRLVVLVTVLTAALLGAGWFWFRGSSFVRVTHVDVTGVTSSAEPRIDAALDAAARGMTTMKVDRKALEQSVAAFPSVAGLTVTTDFPHGMTIDVLERRPVAAIAIGDQRIAVTGDGRLLRDVQDTMGLPAITQHGLPGGERITGPRTTAELAVADAAPPELRRQAQTIGYGDRGLEVDLADGPPLIFGTAAHAAGKWVAAARVLAAPSSAGATYLDLRVPGRVAAGGLAPVVAEDPQGDAVDSSAQPTPTPVATPTPTATPYSQP